MADRPAQICQLEKGKLLCGQQGFVDTFNWAVQAIANLKGGEDCEVSWPLPDQPTIDVTIGEGDEGGGGGSGFGVEDLSVDGADLSVTYTDGTSKVEQLPDAISSITREDVENSDQDVLSVSYLRSTPTTIPLGITLSGTDGIAGNQATEFNFVNSFDSRLSVQIMGHSIQIGVYYI